MDSGENELVIKRAASVMIVEEENRKKANGLQGYNCQFARRHYSIRYSKVKSM